MSAESLSDLLPLPSGCREPHAYQVFGLEGGEQDRKKISAAMKATIEQLKARKETTEPRLWKKAAKLVNEARVVLTDSDKKSQLDARFGIIDLSEPASTPTEPSAPKPPAVGDPLAGILPTADPLASFLPSSDPLATDGSETSASQLPTPPETGAIDLPDLDLQMPGDSMTSTAGSPIAESDLAPPVSGASIPSIQFEDERRASGRSRRRRSSTGMLMFACFMISMLSLVGVLSYFVIFSKGQIAITQGNGQLAVSNQPPAGPTRQAEPIDASPTPSDPVMGEFSEEFAPGPDAGKPSGLVSDMNAAESIASDSPPAGPNGMQMDAGMDTDSMAMNSNPPDSPPDMSMEPDPAPEPEPDTTTPDPDSSSEPAMTSEPAPEMTEEMLATATKEIEQVEELIRSASWSKMLPAAEKLLETPMDADQKTRAEALYELADLATYYRGGISKAVNDLDVGNDFEIANDFRVIVVETGDDLLVVRFNEQNREFKFDEFPFSLAHRLGSFSMPETPGAAAAKAVYQAIAPKAMEAHIEQSMEWLRAIDPETEEVDVARVIETLESIISK